MPGSSTATKPMRADDKPVSGTKPYQAKESSSFYRSIDSRPVRSFIDTNLLVYAVAADEPAKQAIALARLRQLRLANMGVVSTQVLTEFCNVALRKLKISHAQIRNQLRVWQKFEVVQVTTDIISHALDLEQTRSLSFYDALILAVAIESGCAVLLTEDFNAGESVNGVQIVNAFV